MPIYEFECVQCDHVFDRLQKLSDADPTDCPECGKAGIKRRVTAPSFRLAGGGWYETDFKKDGDKKRNLASNDDRPAAGSDRAAADKPAPDKSTSDTPASKSPAGKSSDKPAAAKSGESRPTTDSKPADKSLPPASS